MRIISWNCRHGKVGDYLKILRQHGADADLVTLQECSRPDRAGTNIIWEYTDSNQCLDVVSTQRSKQTNPDREVIWQGIQAVSNGGVAVVSTNRMEFVKIPSLHRTVVPVVVHAQEPFMFVGVWTHPEPSYASVAWEAMFVCAHEAKKRKLPLVAAGDFNISPALKAKKPASDSSKVLQCIRDRLGLVSAYHRHRNEKAGKEKCFTYFHNNKKCHAFHLDYCFVTKVWCKDKNNVRARVEPFPAFKQQSDHRPITIEIKDELLRPDWNSLDLTNGP